MSEVMPSSTRLRVRQGWATDKGRKREQNQDAVLAESPLFLVADGMGGHEAGQIAAALAVESFRPLIGQDYVDLADLEVHTAQAARSVHELSRTHETPGTTLTGVVLSRQRGYPCCRIINIGDSRTYLVNGTGFTRVTRDHSEAQELIDAGQLEAAVVCASRRSAITRAFGSLSGPDVRPDHYLRPARSGDRYVVCSDGLSKEVSEDVIEMVARTTIDPQDAAYLLVDCALQAGGRDNVSVIVLDIMDALPEWPHRHSDGQILPMPGQHRMGCMHRAISQR